MVTTSYNNAYNNNDTIHGISKSGDNDVMVTTSYNNAYNDNDTIHGISNSGDNDVMVTTSWSILLAIYV